MYPSTIGSFSFCAKRALEYFCKVSIESAYRNAKPIEAKSFWEDLLLISTDPNDEFLQDAVISREISEFRGEHRDRGYGAVAILKSGDRIPFGWRRIVNQSSLESALKGVLRGVVSDDIREWRDKWLERHGREALVCAVTGKTVNYRECHVDHFEPTFQQIFEEFKAQYLDVEVLSEIKFQSTAKPGKRIIVSPYEWIAEEFQRFHAAKTLIKSVSSPHLRLISIEGNLKRRSLEK